MEESMNESYVHKCISKRIDLMVICLLVAVLIIVPVMAKPQVFSGISVLAPNESNANQLSVNGTEQINSLKESASSTQDVDYSLYVGQYFYMWAAYSSAGSLIPGVTVVFQRSDNGVIWCPIQSDVTGSNGYAWLTGYTESCAGDVYYRAVAYDGTTSNTLLVQWLQTDPPATCVPPVSCVQQLSLVQVSVVPQNPLNGQPYVIHLLVYNPNNADVTGSISSSETTVLPGWNDKEIISPISNPEAITVPAGQTSDYAFTYEHLQQPFYPLEQEVQTEGEAGVIQGLLSNVPAWVDNLDLMDQWITSSDDVLANIFNARLQEVFQYSFTSSQVNIPSGSYIPVTVDTPLYKKLGWYDAVFSDICGSVYTTIAGPIPSNWEVLASDPAVCVDDLPFCLVELPKLYLSMAEVDHIAIAEATENKALDPDLNYTEPIQVQPIIIPELNVGPETPLKDLVMQYNATVPDAIAMEEAFSKYNGAVEANDSVWELILLKECYHYDSVLGNDYQALNVKAVPAMQYLQENGVQPTAADVESEKQNISQNGLPDFEITLFKQLGYSDLEIDAIKNVTVAVPDAYSVNYSTTILQGLALLQQDNSLEVSNLSDKLGDQAPPYANFTASTTTGVAPVTVQFTDTSLRGPDQWAWNFGDGATDTTQNPEHTYTTAGTYTVSLTVTNSTTGSDTRTIYNDITVYPPPPIANFTV